MKNDNPLQFLALNPSMASEILDPGIEGEFPKDSGD